jgi:hypothetical protein
MRVLVGCEFSGVVRDAFIRAGHAAMSCDLLPTESEGPHYQGNVLDLLKPNTWDLIIMHPECTAVCNAGNKHYGEGKPMYYERVASAYWIGQLWLKCRLICPKICFENPAGVLPKMAGLPAPQFVQPWMHGHPEQKRTGLYLHGLPKLLQSNNVYHEMIQLERCQREAVFYMGPTFDEQGNDIRWKLRATTYLGIANAMAAQWT